MRLKMIACWLLLFLFDFGLVLAQTIDVNPCKHPSKRDTSFTDVVHLYDRYTKRYTGKLSFIGEYPAGLSSCQMDPLPPVQRSLGWIPVAVGPKDYIHSLMCGTCLKIAPRRPKRSIKDFSYDPHSNYYAVVVDQCNHCKTGDIEMYREGEGTHDIIYEAVDCPEIVGPNGFIRLKLNKCDEKKMRIQVKNSKLPTTSVELFRSEAWKCMQPTNNNCFILSLADTHETFTFPMKGRLTTLTGQMLGFTLDYMENNQEITIPAQFGSFDTVVRDVPLTSKCYTNTTTRGTINNEESNVVNASFHKLPNHVQLLQPSHKTSKDVNQTNKIHQVDKQPTTIHIFKNFSNPSLGRISNQIVFKNQSKTNNFTPLVSNNTKIMKNIQSILLNDARFISNATKPARLELTNNNTNHPTLSNSSAKIRLPTNPLFRHVQKTFLLNSTFCRKRSDGQQYSIPGNCGSFLVCSKGASYLKRCPYGLLFNSDDSVCDWPNNVRCEKSLDGSDVFRAIPSEEEEVYTKKFSENKMKFEFIRNRKGRSD